MKSSPKWVFSKRALLLAMFLSLCGLSAGGNDSAASTATGGIQLKREPRIAMAKEKLTISTSKIIVEYEFINESDQDVTTEVAFPIPPYDVHQNFTAGGIRDFEGFHLWINGVEERYKTEAKAMLGAKDLSGVLRKYNVDVASLGHFDDQESPVSRDFRKLPTPAQEELLKEGLFSHDDQFPAWSVEKIYHWQVTFPAHKPIHIRHEYVPAIGFQSVTKDMAMQPVQASKKEETGGYPPPDQFTHELQNACVDPGLKRTVLGAAEKRSYILMSWVDYILTTANSWKTPIKDFELIVEKNSRADYPLHYVSFCWEGSVQKLGSNRFSVTARDFVPKKELNIVFFDFPEN